MAATGINKGASLFDAASGPFEFQIGTLMWPCGTLKICLNTQFRVRANLAGLVAGLGW